MSSVPFKLVTPTQVVFEGDAELVIAVTTEGEEGILPRHAPFLAALKPGVLRANVRNGDTTSRLELATGEGFMQALPDRVTVLVDDAVRFEDVVVADV
ncbi:MAG: ATP synthase F1 subunit epsilon, partial [Candidatus Eremiobacteraeota bacterium]|nr:ATP synthase F1 subunit epsilon [Candidatus Eremiobacteraeota bacterium]